MFRYNCHKPKCQRTESKFLQCLVEKTNTLVAGNSTITAATFGQEVTSLVAQINTHFLRPHPPHLPFLSRASQTCPKTIQRAIDRGNQKIILDKTRQIASQIY